MATLVNHGGHCCGVRHIFGMDNSTEAELVHLITELDNEANQGNRLIEIILSQRQVENGRMADRNPEGGWPAILQRHGFRLVSRFNNSNSSNDCYIFHRVPRFKSIRSADLPFEWEHPRGAPNTAAGVIAAPARPAAPTVVARLWQNVFADGRRGGMYPAFAGAREAAPRCRRVDRVEILSDGAQRVIENVTE